VELGVEAAVVRSLMSGLDMASIGKSQLLDTSDVVVIIRRRGEILPASSRLVAS
jgi:hypothetical protein